MKKAVALACCLAASAAPLHAQTNPPMSYKYDVTTRDVKLHTQLPIMCDQPTRGAADTLNAAGANIMLTNVASIFGSEWISDSNREDQYINILPATIDGYGSSVTTARTYTYNEEPWWYESYGTIIDSNIYVNDALIYYTQRTDDAPRQYDLWCSSTYQGSIGQMADYQSVLLHELGHALGFGHRTDGTQGPCVMAEYLPRGTLKRTLCTDEVQKLRSAYGTR